MEEVWVAEIWNAHGEGATVQGVYESREAAFEGLKAEPNMTVYMDKSTGCVKGRPARERPAGEWVRWAWRAGWQPEKWAVAAPYPVRGRAPATPHTGGEWGRERSEDLDHSPGSCG